MSLWITVAPVRVSVLNRGQTYTLKCNASGDPRPKITWTKDGVPVNQFNVSGYFLHLVNVQRKDAGSYRCTASNGYGKNATSVSIVGIFCTSKYVCHTNFFLCLRHVLKRLFAFVVKCRKEMEISKLHTDFQLGKSV